MHALLCKLELRQSFAVCYTPHVAYGCGWLGEAAGTAAGIAGVQGLRRGLTAPPTVGIALSCYCRWRLLPGTIPSREDLTDRMGQIDGKLNLRLNQIAQVDGGIQVWRRPADAAAAGSGWGWWLYGVCRR